MVFRGTCVTVLTVTGDANPDPSAVPHVASMQGVAGEAVTGPWSCGFVLRTGMQLRSKSNFRRSRRGSEHGGTWERSKAFEESLGWLVRAARPEGWVLGERTVPLDTRPVVVAAIAARSRLDVANFSKSVLDACEGVLYVTDASVLGVVCLGERGVGDDTLLGFAQLDPGATPGAVATALSVLAEHLAGQLMTGN